MARAALALGTAEIGRLLLPAPNGELVGAEPGTEARPLAPALTGAALEKEAAP
jgi:hypothetical protein